MGDRKQAGDEEFRAFGAGRRPRLPRTAFLLTREQHAAEDPATCAWKDGTGTRIHRGTSDVAVTATVPPAIRTPGNSPYDWFVCLAPKDTAFSTAEVTEQEDEARRYAGDASADEQGRASGGAAEARGAGAGARKSEWRRRGRTEEGWTKGERAQEEGSQEGRTEQERTQEDGPGRGAQGTRRGTASQANGIGGHGGVAGPFPYSHPWRRASRIASIRLRVPVLPMADER
jgi:hypothetical protein